MKRFLISLSTGLFLLSNSLPAFASSHEMNSQEEKKQLVQEQAEALRRAQRANILKKKERLEALRERREAIMRKKHLLQKEQELLRQRRLALKRKLGSSVQHGGLKTMYAFLKDIDASAMTLTLQRGNSDVYITVSAKDAEFYRVTSAEKQQIGIGDLVNGSKVRVLLRKNKANGRLHAVVVTQRGVENVAASVNVSSSVGALSGGAVSGEVSTVGPGN